MDVVSTFGNVDFAILSIIEQYVFDSTFGNAKMGGGRGI